ncbi:endo-1,4-beta-xylanase [Granulicella arctica]|uniref:Beta-xylanase n=1 Tax=Granulicella arctica TaxID=940613 RepID=A0A7Y9PI92_9BACT|nr:endo-1,4-beta-xylanase [Granulicella arctica]NYF79608.1 endo-1,4-beta-xylanase [Granulicella arctica]
MNRRDFLTALGATVATKWMSLEVTAQAAAAPLKQLAAQKGLMFGSSLAMKYFDQLSAYKQLFVSQCDIATPEFQMKWNSLSRQPGVYDFAAADQFVAFCVANHIKVRGHTLVWHDSMPAWVPGQLSPTTARAVMLDHIRVVAEHFAGKLYSWDVVNEVLDPGSQRPDGLRASPWLKNIGVDYIEQAFRATAAADPKALLVWNENYLEVSNGFGDAKRKAMLIQLDTMLARSVPIHGIGLEAHLRGDQANVLGDASYEVFLDELAKRGMKIFITELDIQDASFSADFRMRDKEVADVYGKFLTASLRQPAVKGVVTWGLSDSFSWISGYRPRKDGLPVRPLAFDVNCQPKPAYYAIAESLEKAPRRG